MADNELKHYGIPKRSGRYPWGSGDNPYQRDRGFLGYVADLQAKGVSQVQIAQGLGISTTKLRAMRSLAKDNVRLVNRTIAIRLLDKGYSKVAIGKRLGINESTVRSLLDPAINERAQMTKVTSNMLKESVDAKLYIDVGIGTERYMNISRTKLMTAVSELEEEGYRIHKFDIEQVGTGKKTNMMVLTKDTVDYREILTNKDKIRLVDSYSEDGGRTFTDLEPVRSVNSKKVQIQYSEEGGSDKDGVIELRRGVDGISLGESKYAQVRVGVDDKYYMKGMAIYADDLPPGVDIRYNTNKKIGTPDDKVFKPMSDDPDNPFGATVRQKKYIDKDGKEQLSHLNIINEEGDWSKWSNTLSSQMLSKQPTPLAKQQLDLAFKGKQEEYDEIMKLTNPVVRRKLLEEFADDTDSAATHLKAASFPRQSNHTLIPFPAMKPTEVYAPNYRDGERVVLIRHPHGGIFEIPELTVNNRGKDAKRIIGRAQDAIGIHPKVAEQLSGADFDGDSVIVIPNNDRLNRVRTSKPLTDLVGFDPKISYAGHEGTTKMTSRNTQLQMGNISNLITDMTIKGAKDYEIARAVRHSMVVIDAEKHGLDYKQSHIDNGIASLKIKYQGGATRGASTVISRASSEIRVDDRKEGQRVPNPNKPGALKTIYVDPKTGKKLYTDTDKSYVNKEGKTIRIQTKSTRMLETDDAFTLSSGTPMETVYATHANKLKALSNKARKSSIEVKNVDYSPTAKKAYKKEVDTLNANLNIALKNAPLERQAQLIANSTIRAKREANPGMRAEDLKRLKGQELARARARTGALKTKVPIKPREWEAIQAGAVSPSKLLQILNNADPDVVKKLATPRTTTTVTPVKAARVKALLAAGNTQAEVADQLGISTSTISKLTN